MNPRSGCAHLAQRRTGPISAVVSIAIALVILACGGQASARNLVTLVGATPGDTFGGSVAAAGDLNGDGFGDVIVGAYQCDAGGLDAGRAYVYYGGRNVDAKPDIYLTGEAPGDLFGVSVASAGDVNHDGFPDLIVGAHENDAFGANSGRAYIYFGGPAADSKPDVIFSGEAAGDAFGYSVASAGDVNGDGCADVIVGAYENSAKAGGAGRAYIFFGGAQMDNSPDLVFTGEAAGDYFGISVASAGDFNGDKYGDVIVGAYQSDFTGRDAGRAYVFYGGPRADDRPDLILNGAVAGDAFGFSVASAGDLNKDGVGDVIVGAYHNDAGGADAGRAYVFFGGARPDARPDLVLTGDSPGDAFGFSVAAGGDVNGDGFSDVVVGAYGSDAGGSAAGRSYVYFGGATPDAVSDFTVTGEATLDNLGYAVSGALDLDGDGFGDVAVAAPFGDAGRVYLCSPMGGKQRPVAGR
jgi:FG-GAP repeat protein